MVIFVVMMVGLYARPGELLRLRRKELLPPMEVASRTWSVLLFPSDEEARSKVGESDDSLRVDFRMTPWLPQVLKVMAAGDSDAHVFQFGYPGFARAFRAAAAEEGLPPIVPYQARHSGASIDAAEMWRGMASIQKRGRWRSWRSVTRYEKHARLQASFQKLPPPVRARCLRRAQELEVAILGAD